MKLKKIISGLMLCTLIMSTNLVYAQDVQPGQTTVSIMKDGREVYSTFEPISRISESDLNISHTGKVKVSRISSQTVYEVVYAKTTCTVKSTGKAYATYSRARWEDKSGNTYRDSGREWDSLTGTPRGYSEATSDEEQDSWANRGWTAHTYYGY